MQTNAIKADEFFNTGILKQQDGHHDDAILYFSQAVDLDALDVNDTSDVYFCRGTAYAELKRYETALEDFEVSVALNPRHFRALGWRGVAWYKLNNYQQALEDFTKSLQIRPDFTELYQYRGMVRTYLGDDEGAVRDWDQFLKIHPTHAEAYYRRGIAKAILGQHYQALRDLYTAQRHGNPDSELLIKQIEYTTDNIYRIIQVAA